MLDSLFSPLLSSEWNSDKTKTIFDTGKYGGVTLIESEDIFYLNIYSLKRISKLYNLADKKYNNKKFVWS